MSDGAFRDASAALERAAALEQENADMAAELRELRGVASEAQRELKGETLTSVRAELKSTVTQLNATERDLKIMHDNYRVLRRERDQLVEEAGREKARAARLEGQLESIRSLSGKERAMKQQLDDAELANTRMKEEIKKREDEIADLKRLVHQAATLHKRASTQHESQLADARAAEMPENYQAFLTRLEEERQELLVEVNELRAKVATKREPSLLGSLLGRR